MTASSLEIWHADLIDRLYRIERAFLWRRHTNLHFRAKSMPKEIQTSYESVYKDYCQPPLLANTLSRLSEAA